MDPQGILMLNSVREIFNIVGISFESMKFIARKFDNQNSIIDAIHNRKKCPAIVGAKLDFSTGSIDCIHVMIASGVKSETVGASTKYFIQCKNSYRDDPNISGKCYHIESLWTEQIINFDVTLGT